MHNVHTSLEQHKTNPIRPTGFGLVSVSVSGFSPRASSAHCPSFEWQELPAELISRAALVGEVGQQEK